RMPVNDLDQCYRRVGRRCLSRFIFLEGTLATSEYTTSLFLGQLETRAQISDAFRIVRSHLPVDLIPFGKILAGVDGIALILRVPAGDVYRLGVDGIGHRPRSNITPQRLARLRVDSCLIGHDQTSLNDTKVKSTNVSPANFRYSHMPSIGAL